MKKYYKGKGEERSKLRPYSLAQQFELGFYKNTSSEIYGDALFMKIMQTINEFGEGEKRIKLRVDQRTMLAYTMGALLPLIYRNKLEANRERLLEKLQLEEINQEMIIIASRRAGKTWFVAIVLAALMICLPEVEIACFALAKRTSQKMMRLVVDMLMLHPNCPKILKHNSEELMLEGPSPSQYKLLHSFPDTTHVSTIVAISVLCCAWLELVLLFCVCGVFLGFWKEPKSSIEWFFWKNKFCNNTRLSTGQIRNWHNKKTPIVFFSFFFEIL